MGEGQGISIIGTANVQQIITALNRINGQVLALNNQLRKQGALAHKSAAGHKTAGKAATGHANSMKSLALRFVGYNLAMNMVMDAQQKLIQFMGESIDKFREFELRLAEVSTILQDDVDQMHRFKVGIEDLATSYGQSTSDISKGLYDILSAAFASRDAMNLLNTSIKASIAGLSDVRTSVKIFTTVLNSYGKSAEQATHVSDVLFQAVVRGKFQFADLEQALGYVVPIAAQAGITFDELSAALSTATRHGLHVDMTARGLALAIQGIINPSTQAAQAATEYGVRMDGLSLRVLGLKGWFDQLGTAMDKYGKSILGELIPNMRSLRVAMVLAGEEGAKGFAEDLIYLENVSGRTDVALKKIMETQSFMNKQIEQQKEQLQRSIAEPWSEGVLAMKQYVLGLVYTFQMMWTVVSSDITDAGEYYAEYATKIQKLYGTFGKALGAGFEALGSADKASAYIDALKEAERISTELGKSAFLTEKEIKDLNAALEIQSSIMNITRDAYNNYVGGIQDTQDALADFEITLDEIEIDMKKLRKEIESPITVGWGKYEKTLEGILGVELEQLLMAQQLKDSQHDVKMGLVDSEYAWKTNNSALKDAVDIVREHEDAQKKDTAATNAMTRAMRLLQIAMLEIQLKGMLRRRGLTRSEEKQMKRLQIEQAKLRLENMKNTQNETQEVYDNYELKKQYIAEFLARLEEESYQVSYTNQYAIDELRKRITSEKSLLEERKLEYEMINNEIFLSSVKLVTDLNNLPTPIKAFMEEDGTNIAEAIESATAKRSESQERGGTYVPHTIIKEELIASGFPLGSPDLMRYTSSSTKTQRAIEGTYEIGQTVGFRRGTEYVPETMPAIVHRGETITAAGKDAGGGDTVIQNVTIQVKEIAEIGSAEKIAAVLSEATDRRIITTEAPRARNKKAGNTYRVI